MILSKLLKGVDCRLHVATSWMILAVIGRKTPRCQQRWHSRTCCSSCRVIPLVGCFCSLCFLCLWWVFCWLADCCGQRHELKSMLKLYRIFGNWRVGSVAAEKMFLLLQQEPAPAAEEGLQDGVLVFFDLFCGCYKGVSVSPGLSKPSQCMWLYRHQKHTSRIWTFATIAIRWCKMQCVF